MEREEREIWERKKKVGSVCFGFKLIPKILFRKCGCLVAHGKYIFRKCFSVWSCVGCKMISVFILPSNIIFRKTEWESESEIAPAHKERERKRERERERERKKREPIAGDPWAFDFTGDPETSRHEPTNKSSTSPANPEPSTHWSSTQSLRPMSLRLRRQPKAFDFAKIPRTNLSFCVILISVWFWFLLLLWWCGWWCFGGFRGGGFCVGSDGK